MPWREKVGCNPTFSYAIHFLTGGAPPERDAVKKNSHDVNFFFTAPIFAGDGDGKNEMLRKKFYVRREFFYVRRDIFYVASIFDGEASRQNRPPPFHFSTPDSPSIAPHRFAQGSNRDRQPRARVIQKAAIQAMPAFFCNFVP